MAEPLPSDHDQRLKVLLKEFFEQFLLCFFPEWAACFDFSTLTWLDKEVFLAPPQGDRRISIRRRGCDCGRDGRRRSRALPSWWP